LGATSAFGDGFNSQINFSGVCVSLKASTSYRIAVAKGLLIGPPMHARKDELTPEQRFCLKLSHAHTLSALEGGAGCRQDATAMVRAIRPAMHDVE
jgi:hypothetical protein